MKQYDGRLNAKTSTRKSAKPHTRTSATRYVTGVFLDNIEILFVQTFI